MNKFFAIIKIEKIKNSIIEIFSRFFISGLISIFTTIIGILMVENVKFFNVEFEELFISLIITFFFSVGFYVLAESLNWSKFKKHILQIIPFIIGGSLYFTLINLEVFRGGMIFVELSIMIAFTFLFIAPFLKNVFSKDETNSNNFYSYISGVSLAFLYATLIGTIFLILGEILFFTIYVLFDVDFNHIFEEVIIVSTCLIGGFTGMSYFPNKKTFEAGIFNEIPVVLLIIKYIFIPFIYIYIIILYIYTAKVLIHFGDWPKGQVSWLVILFSIIGYFIYTIGYIYEDRNSSLKFFRKIFPFVIFPQLFMLFYSIYLRVNQYSWTINRYYVVAFGVLILIITLYYIFSKKKNISFSLFALFFTLIIISMGPWSVYNLPKNAQTKLLMTELKEIGVLDEAGNLTKIKIDVEDNEENKVKVYQINEKLEYLCRQHNCNELYELIFKEKFQEENEYHYLHDGNIREKLGLEYVSEYDLSEKNSEKKNINYYSNFVLEDISGYDVLNQLSSYDGGNIIFLKKNNKEVAKVDISEFWESVVKENETENLSQKYENGIYYDMEWEKYKIKLIISDFNIEIKNKEKNKFDVNRFYGWVLFSEK